MDDFPEAASGPPVDVRALLETIRAGLAAEYELCNLCGTDPRVAAWLRASGVLSPDADHPDSSSIIGDVYSEWLQELRCRQNRYRSYSAFWDSLRSRVREVARALHWSRVPKAKREGGGARPDHGPASFDSLKLVFMRQMEAYEDCFVPPVAHADQKHFGPLCRTLYRLCVWRYLVRRARNPNAGGGRLMPSYTMLAALVHGFGPDLEAHKNRGRTIGNWLRPSMLNFRAALDREDVRRLWREPDED